MRSILAVLSLLIIPANAFAQGTAPRADVFGSVAATRVFRVEDRSFGTELSFGGGAEFRVLPRLGIGVEMNRTNKLTPLLVDCGRFADVERPCTGSAREGVERVTILSATAAWYFGGGRAQPYVIGGMDVLWSRDYSSVTYLQDPIRIEELASDDRGFGITAGFGVRIAVGPHLVIRPEWRLYDGSLMGRANLGAMRTSVGIGYAW